MKDIKFNKHKRTLSALSFHNVLQDECTLEKPKHQSNSLSEASNYNTRDHRRHWSPVVTLMCTCVEPQTSTIEMPTIDRQNSSNKSTIIVLSIVLLFILTHSFRLVLKVYEVIDSQSNTMENFLRCYDFRR